MSLNVHQTDAGVLLTVLAKPNARKGRIVGLHGDSLKVAVAAPPEKGKANKALAELLAAQLSVPSSHVAVVSGEASRHKRVLVQGLDAAQVLSRLGLQ